MSSIDGREVTDAEWIKTIRQIEDDLSQYPNEPVTLPPAVPQRSLQMHDYKAAQRDETTAMEATAMMLVFLVGAGIGLCLGVLATVTWWLA